MKRVDLIARVNGQLYIIDFKTSQDVWPSFEMQVSAYRVAVENGENPISKDLGNGNKEKRLDVSDLKTAILQVGYKRNKAGWKWTDVEDKFDLFLAAKQIWAHECEGQAPKVRDYPIVISPGTPTEHFEMLTQDEVVKIDAAIAPLETSITSPKRAVRKAK